MVSILLCLIRTPHREAFLTICLLNLPCSLLDRGKEHLCQVWEVKIENYHGYITRLRDKTDKTTKKCPKFGIISSRNKTKTLYNVYCKIKLAYHHSTTSVLTAPWKKAFSLHTQSTSSEPEQEKLKFAFNIPVNQYNCWLRWRLVKIKNVH